MNAGSEAGPQFAVGEITSEQTVDSTTAVDLLAESDIELRDIGYHIPFVKYAESRRPSPGTKYVIRGVPARLIKRIDGRYHVIATIGCRLTRPYYVPEGLVEPYHGCVFLDTSDKYESWFLMKDGRLGRVNSRAEQQILLNNDGLIYYCDGRSTSIMAVIDYTPNQSTTPEYQLEIEIKSLKSERPTTWGGYARTALHRYQFDTVYIQNFNQLGGLPELWPSFFRLDPPAVEMAHAELASLKVVDKNGLIVMTYKPRSAQ